MPEVLIEFESVTKRFGDLIVLDDISFVINKGEITTIMGKSGMGKSVILKHMIGLMRPDSGRILVDGADIARASRAERKRLKGRMGYLFQGVALFDAMTVFDNVALPLREKTGLSEPEIRRKVMDKLEKLEVGATAHKYPSEISGGMQKRVGLARALINDPEVVLFDEPTTGLDPIRKNAVHSMISHMQRRFGFTGVVVSHDIPDIFHISQKIIMLDQGKAIADCTPAEIERVSDPVVRDFIRGSETLKDDVTGLDNKTQIIQRFQDTIVPSETTDSNFAIIVFVVPDMDDINETRGFPAGQRVLQHLAAFLETSLRISGDSFRYSGDILVSVLPGTTAGMASVLVRKLGSRMSGFSVPDVPLPVSYTVEAGVAEAKGCSTMDDLVEKALTRMDIIGRFELDDRGDCE